MHWLKLRPIQVNAIHEILDGEADLIIAARTAAGKTEAAFLPILSLLLSDPSPGIRAVYVGPLKALINDQFSRLEQLCEEAEIPVHKWHGDVSSTPKRRLLEHPSGVLLITPESIESLFVNHPHRLASVFPSLAFVVIDELHSFIGTERGAHMRSLICRLGAKSVKSVRRAGLSATLGPEIGEACRWLQPSHAESVKIIEDPEKKSIQLRISAYLEHSSRQKQKDEDRTETSANPLEGRSRERRLRYVPWKNRPDLREFKVVHRGSVQTTPDGNRRGADYPTCFSVHHGSLSKSEREETEEALKSGRAHSHVLLEHPGDGNRRG